MSKPWVVLSTRYGGDVVDPTTDDMLQAIQEPYVEHISGMTEGDFEEHGAAFLQYGYDDGPVFVLDVTRGGIVTFEERADQEYNIRLAPAKVMHSAPSLVALKLWTHLANGNLERVRDHPWRDAAGGECAAPLLG